MFDDFFIRALFAGIGIALITGPFGCFIIWRRFSFFAGTLAHSALLGVTMAVFFDINIGRGTPHTLCLDTHQSGLVSIIDFNLSFPLLG